MHQNQKNTAPAVEGKLYCIELLPVKKEPTESEFVSAYKLLHSKPESDFHRLMIGSQIMNGITDQRESHYATYRQRIALWSNRSEASKWAAKTFRLHKPYWRWKVREARLMA